MTLEVFVGEVVARTGPLVSVVAIAASVVGSLIAARLSKTERVSPPSLETKDIRELVRIAEIASALQRQERIATWSGRADVLLVFGQVVIGGLLASTFLQDELSKSVIGLLGVLVLVASLVHKQFRPDVNYAAARQRAVLHRQLLRETEDEVLFIQQREIKSPNADAVERLRRNVTHRLFEIEMAEAQDPHQAEPTKPSAPKGSSTEG